MSDLSAHKKGIRTFASDFERIHDAMPPAPAPVPTPTSTSKPTPVPVPVPKNTATIKTSTVPTPDRKIPTPPQAISKTSQEPDVPKKIPAFHEIEKSLKDMDLAAAKDSNKSNQAKPIEKGITPSKQVGGGAIITDTKTSSFSLFKESKKSITDWFKSRKKKRSPQLAVPKADRRKGIIQQATTRSGTIFTADNETLKERIKARKQQEQNKQDEPETNWSPYTETGYPLLESGEEPVTANVVVAFKKRSVPVAPQPISDPTPTTEPVVQTDQIPAAPTPPIEEPAMVQQITEETAPVQESPVIESEPDRWAEPAQIVAEPEVEKNAEPTAIPAAPETTDAPETKKSPTKQQSPEPILVETYKSGSTATGLTTNQLTMYISAGISLLLATGIFGWFVVNSTPNLRETTNQPVEQFLTQANTEIIIVDQSFRPAVLQNYTGTAAYTEIVLQNSDQQMLPAALVFDLVTPEIPTTIQQFSTDVRFVQFGSTAPQMLMSIVDPTSVTGALLANETKLISALAPLYGPIETGTFADTTIAGTDVRVLTSGTRQTLTYGIINGETLVIAISPDAFAEINTLLAD